MQRDENLSPPKPLEFDRLGSSAFLSFQRRHFCRQPKSQASCRGGVKMLPGPASSVKRARSCIFCSLPRRTSWLEEARGARVWNKKWNKTGDGVPATHSCDLGGEAGAFRARSRSQMSFALFFGESDGLRVRPRRFGTNSLVKRHFTVGAWSEFNPCISHQRRLWQQLLTSSDLEMICTPRRSMIQSFWWRRLGEKEVNSVPNCIISCSDLMDDKVNFWTTSGRKALISSWRQRQFLEFLCWEELQSKY